MVTRRSRSKRKKVSTKRNSKRRSRRRVSKKRNSKRRSRRRVSKKRNSKRRSRRRMSKKRSKMNGGTTNCSDKINAVNTLKSCISTCHTQSPNAEAEKNTCQKSVFEDAKSRRRKQKETAYNMAEGREISDSPLRDAKLVASNARSVGQGGKHTMFKPKLQLIQRGKELNLAELPVL